MKIKNIKKIMIFCLLTSLVACQKKLDIKPDQAMVLPRNASDLQAFLDYDEQFNSSYPILGEAGSDNYYILDTRYNSLTLARDKNVYVWAKDLFNVGDQVNDWNMSFSRIFTCNVVLDELGNVVNGEANSLNDIQGEALFFRAYSYYALTQIFCKSFDQSTSETDLGLPIRSTSNINKVYQRSNLKDTYTFIINDLLKAETLLPNIETVKTRPSKIAVYGLLARIYLSMKDYANAYKYSNAALNIYSQLSDYNDITLTATLPFARFNTEVFFHSSMNTISLISSTNSAVNPDLYNMYSTNDLRKTGFFRTQSSGLITFKGTYSGNSVLQFNGLATDEMFLIRAETNARLNKVTEALDDLNTLYRKRWKKTVVYQPITATTATDALKFILDERRKELIFRGLRWSDLRRLNSDGANILLQKTVNGIVYTLPPNDLRYTYSIPPDEINVSGIEQNKR